MLTRNLRNKKARYICIRSFFSQILVESGDVTCFFGFGFGGSVGVARAYVCVLKWYFKTKGKRRRRFFFFAFPLAFFCCFFSVRPTVYIEVAPPLVNNNATRLHTPINQSFFLFPLSYRSSSRNRIRSQTPPRDGDDPRLTSLFYTEIERPLKMVKICFTAISLSRWYSIFCWCFCFVFWVSYIKSVANEWKENLKMFFYSISRR